MGLILYGVEKAKRERFGNVHLHCMVSILKKISKISTLPSLEKIHADAYGCTQARNQLGTPGLVAKNFLRWAQIF